LQQHNVPLNAGSKGAAGNASEQKHEDQKVGEAKKFVVKKETTTLYLQKNEFRTIANLSKILKDVMWNHEKLQWIDLSYNYLERIEDVLVTDFPCLKTLYLHGNYILEL
jgi:hypothetical protein